MKVLLINGSPHQYGCTYTALAEVAQTLGKHAIETEILYLGKSPWQAAWPAAAALRLAAALSTIRSTN